MFSVMENLLLSFFEGGENEIVVWTKLVGRYICHFYQTSGTSSKFV